MKRAIEGGPSISMPTDRRTVLPAPSQPNSQSQSSTCVAPSVSTVTSAPVAVLRTSVTRWPNRTEPPSSISRSCRICSICVWAMFTERNRLSGARVSCAAPWIGRTPYSRPAMLSTQTTRLLSAVVSPSAQIRSPTPISAMISIVRVLATWAAG